MTSSQRLFGIDEGCRRVCAGCGATAPGMFPEGWAIEKVHGSAWGSKIQMIVGERPYCPGCQTSGQAAAR
ncbi:MAG: hypothetical protein ACR2QA_09295 [Solirubrobacteraceae bacterium]